jgi:heme exporter protein B
VIALGATCKTLILGLNQGSALLGLLILPLTLPVLIMGINTLTQLHMGLSVNGNLAFLGGLSLLSFAALPFAMAAALRLGMET